MNDACTASRIEESRILTLLKARGCLVSTLFDVGATTGVWTRQALAVFPCAASFMFEPRLAFEDIPLSPGLIDNPRLRRFPLAIGDRNGFADLHVTADPAGSTTLEWDAEAAHSTPRQVEMRTIDALIAEGTVPVPDLVKIDVQGGEMAALRGAAETLSKVKALHLETWLVRSYGSKTPLLSEIVAFLQPFGFHLFDFGDSYRLPDGTLQAIDATFERD